MDEKTTTVAGPSGNHDSPAVPVDPQNQIEQSVRRRSGIFRGLFLVIAIWCIAFLTICLDQALSWTNCIDGLMNAAFVGWFFALVSLVYLIPLGLLCTGIVHLTPWRRHRRWFLLVPALLVLLVSTVPRALDRVHPARRFEHATGLPLPASARNLRTEFSGGMFADLTQVYTFDCAPADTVRLIEGMHLECEADSETHIIGGTGGGFSAKASGWSSPQRWTGKVRKWDFFEFLTNDTKTKVRIVLGTI